MSQALKNAKDPTATKKSAKVVVRLARSKNVPAVTPAMKRTLRAKAKNSKRNAFPELPEWRLEG
jgi:hypothetical protein